MRIPLPEANREGESDSGEGDDDGDDDKCEIHEPNQGISGG